MVNFSKASLSNPHSSFQFCSQISNINWPQILNPWAGGVVSMLYQLDQTQYYPPDNLKAQQWQQASALLEHAYNTTPFYQDLYAKAGINLREIKGWSEWRKLPVIDRNLLQKAASKWHSKSPPVDHGKLLQHFTSGSTGRPLQSLSTMSSHLIKIALVLRQHHWAGRDTQQKVVFIQEIGDASLAEHRHSSNWESATEHIIKTGPALVISVRKTVADQIKLIREFKPAYLITYPSVIAALAKHCLQQDIRLPFLRQVGSYGEILEPSCRSLAREAWNARIVDNYSAKEMGPIAMQCPMHEHYHIHAEAVVAEVLNANGQECAPGETGRLVLTSLHNFAAPMIRYDIGDFAIQGEGCDCGRTLPVISRILGRQRNILKFPDGSERWPSLGEGGFTSLFTKGIPEIQQFQLIQHSRERIEARIVTQRPYSCTEESLVADYLRSQLGAHWHIDFSYPPVIERAAGGKYEDFLSHCS